MNGRVESSNFFSTVPTPADTGGRLARGTSLGRYVVLDLVGEGGMGSVYGAYDAELDRKIAIKVLRPDAPGRAAATDDERRARLLREAQALARLRHLHVVQVHDVGIIDGRVFLVMDWIEGRNLRRWLDEGPHSWREAMRVFVPAGRALAAAHAAGIVHRDFKPENVMVGADGHVTVVDFGLARAAAAPGDEAVAAPDALSSPVTRTGTLVGTPAYMAPEQLARGEADVHTDQFSYCVALYEALFGKRPFASARADQLVTAVAAGPPPGPSGTRVPRWLRDALGRGLNLRADDRFASMDDLLRALELGTRRRRWRALAPALAGALAAAFLFGWRVAGPGATCHGAEGKLAGVWDAGRHAEVHAALLTTGAPHAEDAWRAASAALDEFAGAWTRMHREACEATQVRGEQSPALLDLRMECLHGRLRDLRASVDVLAHPSSEVAARALETARALPAIDECADAKALRARGPAPARDPARLEAAARRLAEAQARHHAGQLREALELARGAAAEARQVGWRPLEAEAALRLGQIELSSGDPGTAEEHLLEALVLADGAGLDHLSFEIRVGLVAAVGWLQARFREGHVWAREAGALLERMGGNELLEASLLAMLGNVDHKEGHYDEALEHLRRALAIQERAYGPWDPRVADASRGVSVALYRAARYAEAEAPARRALEIRARVLGAHHPDTGDAHAGLASVLNLLGRFDEAVAHFKEAIAILEAIHGADGLYLAIPLHNLGNVYLERDRPEEALAYYRRARAIREKAFGVDNTDAATSACNEADALRELGRAAEARSEYQRVLGVFERGLGAEHPFVAYPLTGLGRAELTLGRPEQAIVPLERALAVRAKRADPAELAETRFFLGRALWEAGRDRGRGRALVAQAADDYATAGAQASLRVHREGAEARAWLGRRGGEVR